MNASKDDREVFDVSLFILSLNRAEYFAEAVRSAWEQTHRAHKIVILDNVSSHDFIEVMEPWIKRGVEWVGSDRTNSPFWNMRRAFKLAQGKYFVIMHDDNHLCQSFLKEQSDFLDQNP